MKNQNAIKLFLASLLFMAILSVVACGKSYSQNKPVKTTVKSSVVKDTIIKGVSHHLFVGAKGGRYIFVVSKKTGIEYKRYFPVKKK